MNLKTLCCQLLWLNTHHMSVAGQGAVSVSHRLRITITVVDSFTCTEKSVGVSLIVPDSCTYDSSGMLKSDV